MLAQYVTVWDNGTVLKTLCQYDATNQIADGILMVDLEGEGVGSLKETYIELGEGEQVRTFFNDDQGVQYNDGQPEG